jgi:hypothetical protein
LSSAEKSEILDHMRFREFHTRSDHTIHLNREKIIWVTEIEGKTRLGHGPAGDDYSDVLEPIEDVLLWLNEGGY